MPGIERVPLWVRWALFVVVVTALASLLTDRAFTFAGVLTVGLISLAVAALFTATDRAAARRRGQSALAPQSAFIAAYVVLVGWSAFWLGPLFEDLTPVCAEAASEISDPCGMGALFDGSARVVAWAAVALPLGVVLYRFRGRP